MPRLGQDLITKIGYNVPKIDQEGSNGLGAATNSVAYLAQEIDRHVHSYERWFGLAAVPDGELHRADRVATGITAFQMDAGNDDWGAWLQILGSEDTPAGIGKTYFDLHRLMITAIERNNVVHFVQIAFGATGAAALTAGTYTELVYKPLSVQAQEWPFPIQTRRIAAGVKGWARVLSLGQDTGTLDTYIGLHEYEG